MAAATANRNSQLNDIITTQNDNHDDNDESHPTTTTTIADDLMRRAAAYRPNLGDEYRVGFFGQDHSTQTNPVELPTMKELSVTSKQLLKEMNTLKRALSYLHCSLDADFELKLKQASLELYVRVNERLVTLEKMHSEKVEMIRAAYRQQLCDAIVQIHSYYNSDFKRKIKGKKGQEKESGDVEKVKKLKAVLEAKDATIDMLMKQLEDCQNRQMRTDTEDKDKDKDKEGSTDPCSELRQQIESLRNKITMLEEKLTAQENAKDDLKREIEKLTRSLLNAQSKIEKMAKMTGSVPSTHAIEVTKEAPRDSDAGHQALMEKKMAEEKKALEALLAQGRLDLEAMRKRLQDCEDARRNELDLASEVDRLKKELSHAVRMWKKRFELLQESMRALKDEFFLRQTLERKAAVLHTASLSFAYDAPCDVPQRNFPRFSRSHSPRKSRKYGLPGIGRCRPSGDFISYQVAPPTERKKYIFSGDENQILSDEEDLQMETVVLPSPPPGVFRIR